MILTKMVAHLLFKDDPAGKEKVQASLNQMKQASANLGQATSKLGASLKPLAVGFTAVMGGATVAFKNFLSSYDNVAKTARDIGIGAEAFQELTYSAKEAGISQDQFSKSLAKLSRLTVQAQKGAGDSADVFKQLGISIFNADGSARDFEEIFMEFSDVMKKVPDKASRAAIAVKLLGEKGARMGAFLGEGSESIEIMRQRARDLGIVVSEETLTSVENVGNEIGRLGETVKGLWAHAIAGILPLIENLVTELQAWTQENSVILRQNLSNFISGLVSVIQKLLPVVFTLVKYWQWLVAGFVVFQGIKIGFAIVGLVKAFKLLTIESWKLNLSFLANPILLIVLTVVGAVALLSFWFYKLQKDFGFFTKGWEKLKNGLKRIVDGVKNIASAVKEKLVSAFNLVKDAILTLWEYHPLKYLIDFLKDPLGSLKNLGNALSDIFEQIGKSLSGIFEKYAPEWLKKMMAWFSSDSDPAPAPSAITPRSMPSTALMSSMAMGGGAGVSSGSTFNFNPVIHSNDPMIVKHTMNNSFLRDFERR